jgi:hypothetical protein
MHNFKIINLLIIIILMIMISGCCSYEQKDFNFNSKDLEYVSSFKQGDTIYYESSSGDIDTVLIHKIDSIQKPECSGLFSKPANNYLFISIRHLPNDKLWSGTTTDSSGKTEINYQNLITIDKRPQMKEIDFSINFKDFNTSKAASKKAGELHTDTVSINNLRITNYFVIRHGYPERINEPENIEVIYWTNKDGLMAYKNKRGDWWTKKSK